MNDPVTGLGNLSPVAPNRDELLFAAGRATARPNRWWKASAALLALTQAATLTAWLWPRAATPIAPPPVPVIAQPVAVPEPTPEPDVPPASQPDPQSYLALWLRDGEPAPRERLAPAPPRAERPLTAGDRRFD